MKYPAMTFSLMICMSSLCLVILKPFKPQHNYKFKDLLSSKKLALVQKDFVSLERAKFHSKRQTLRDKSRLWPGGVVPYVIEEGFTQSEVEIIVKAFKWFDEYTCVKWTLRKEEEDYVSIFKGHKCLTTMGRTGGRQWICLDESYGFEKDIMHPVHEMMHILGFVHEHSRPDRDTFVNIHEENIDKTKCDVSHDYVKFLWRDVRVLGPYDYQSIMHYTKYTYSKNGKPTMTRKDDPDFFLGGVSPTAGDIHKINRLYECNEATLKSKIGADKDPHGS